MYARRRLLRGAAVAASAAAFGSVAHAASYPSRSVRVVVAFPPGGSADIIARIVAQELSLALHGSFYIENRGGAGGMVGTQEVARGAPNGYILLLGNSGALASGLSLYQDLQYDVMKDFAPIAMVADVTIVLAVKTSLPAGSVDDLVALAKAKPGTLNSAIPSAGSMHHLLTELFKLRTGIATQDVIYKGSSPAIEDLIAGRVDMDFDNLPALLPFIKAGRVKGLAVAAKTRSELLPDLPTMAEVGLPEVTASPWFALMAPAGTPPDIIQALNAELAGIMRSPEMKTRMEQQGANPLWSTPSACGEFIQGEIKKWAAVVKEAGIKPE
jgi:tripartite-type tricarboxylate transporter receptor subunit TctC